jgi:regulator of protease activity HflC (stomatin/prohibitin superfamily)
MLNMHLGVELLALSLEDLHPPQPVVKNYYDVTRALATRSRLITEAQIDKEKAISRETVVTSRQRAEAAGDSAARMTQAAAERDAFLAMVLSHHMLGGAPTPGLASLFDRLTTYRLTLDAAEQLLAQRPKVLRDSRLKGTIQVIPESLRWRLPSLQETSPPKPELP